LPTLPLELVSSARALHEAQHKITKAAQPESAGLFSRSIAYYSPNYFLAVQSDI
jgi:hypothetical protein